MNKLLTDFEALALAKTLCNQGIDHDQAQRHFEAISSYDAVISQFSQSRKLELTEVLAKAMYNKGCSLMALKADREAIAAFDALIVRFETNEDEAVAMQVAKAFMNKANRLGALRQMEASVDCYEKIVKRYHHSPIADAASLARVAQDFLQERLRILSSQTQAARA